MRIPDIRLMLWAVPLALALSSVAPASAQENQTRDLPPAGFGTLRQESILIGLRAASLEIQVVPLDERVIRLLAPDTYASLHRLVENRAREIELVAERYGLRAPKLFLVTFFGRQVQARFEPEFLTITSQNRLFRVLEILPLSPLWSGRQLSQRETATAIYVFEDGIRILDPMTVAYSTITNDTWVATLRRLDRERASVIARAGRRNP